MDIMHWRVGHVTALAGITSFRGGGVGGGSGGGGAVGGGGACKELPSIAKNR